MTLSYYALIVKPRAERHVEQLLTQKGYESFVPLYPERHRWSDRYKTVDLPLFPGYAFSRFDLPQRTDVLKTPGVSRIVSFDGLPAAIPESQIAIVRRIVTSGAAYGPTDFLEIGERIRVIRGPLSGIEGLVLGFRSSLRLVVSIHLLQRSVAAEISGDDVIPLRPAATAFLNESLKHKTA